MALVSELDDENAFWSSFVFAWISGYVTQLISAMILPFCPQPEILRFFADETDSVTNFLAMYVGLGRWFYERQKVINGLEAQRRENENVLNSFESGSFSASSKKDEKKDNNKDEEGS